MKLTLSICFRFSSIYYKPKLQHRIPGDSINYQLDVSTRIHRLSHKHLWPLSYLSIHLFKQIILFILFIYSFYSYVNTVIIYNLHEINLYTCPNILFLWILLFPLTSNEMWFLKLFFYIWDNNIITSFHLSFHTFKYTHSLVFFQINVLLLHKYINASSVCIMLL